jgi:hypothetical protein
VESLSRASLRSACSAQRQSTEGIPDPSDANTAQDEPPISGQVEQVDIHIGLGDLAEDGGSRPGAVLNRRHDNLALLAAREP